MAKWKKTEAGGYCNVDVDQVVWCPCIEWAKVGDENTVRIQAVDPGKSENVSCPNCGKLYRIIVSITVQELEATNG